MRVFMRFPNGLAKALTLSYDDGVVQDERMIALLDRNGIKATFNLNSGLYPTSDTVFAEGDPNRKLTKEQATMLYTDCGHEVAMHGLTHAFMEKLPNDCALFEALEDRKNLEQQFHRPIRGLAYPWGTYSDKTVDVLKKAGVSYARTTCATEDFRLPENWLLWNPTCHHFCPRLMQLAGSFANGSPIQDPYQRSSWLFYLWGHSYEFDAVGSWKVIEDFAQYIGNREDIWYATNGDIYNYVESYRHLDWTLTGDAVFNPTALPIWFEVGEEIYCVQPGDFLQIE